MAAKYVSEMVEFMWSGKSWDIECNADGLLNVQLVVILLSVFSCLQCCFPAGWLSGRASGPYKLCGEVFAWLFIWSEVRIRIVCILHDQRHCYSSLSSFLPLFCQCCSWKSSHQTDAFVWCCFCFVEFLSAYCVISFHIAVAY